MTDPARLCRELVARRPGDRVGSAVALAAAKWRRGGWVESCWYAGTTSWEGSPCPVDGETLFDLASLSKPVTALTAARLSRYGALDLAAPLARYLPETEPSPSGEVPLDWLLAHRAGLVAHRPLFRALLRGQWVRRSTMLREAAHARRAEATAPHPEHGYPPEYSDLGYLLMGEAVARAAALPLDSALSEMVLAPLHAELGSARAWRRKDARASQRFAATEHVAWRGGVLRGVVHDENAWAYSGEGASGHAGLFGTARGVLRLGEGVLDALAGRVPDFLRADELGPLVRTRQGGSLRAGFDGKSQRASSAGSRFGSRTFGHLGFTGTSFWCDPDAELVGVLLTNRVHPTRDSHAIRVVRPQVYDAMAAWAERRL